MFFTATESESRIGGAVDEYGDSFARDITVDELKEVRKFSAAQRLLENSSVIRLSTPCLLSSNTASVSKISRGSLRSTETIHGSFQAGCLKVYSFTLIGSLPMTVP